MSRFNSIFAQPIIHKQETKSDSLKTRNPNNFIESSYQHASQQVTYVSALFDMGRDLCMKTHSHCYDHQSVDFQKHEYNE